MIKMIAGRFGLPVNGIIKAMDKDSGPFNAGAEQEARLVKLGMAVYVGVAENATTTDAPIGFDEIPEDEDGEDGEGASLEDMSANDLRALGKEYGLSFKVGTKKADMIEAIKAAYPDTEDEPAPADENPNEGGADGQDNSYKDDEVLEIVDGHFAIESLMKLERKHMEALATDLEIEADAIKKCKNKTELANLIAEVEVGDEDENPNEGGEPAPTFDAAEAVQ